jgi:heptosyltransferase II
MRILVEIPSWLGDSVMATPAIENLFKFYSQSEFIIVGSKISIEVLKNHPNISKTYILHRKYFSMFLLSRKLKKFDKFFSFRNSFRSNLFKFFINSNEKFIYKKNDFKKNHQVEKYMKFINNSLKTDYPIGPLVIHSNKFLKENSNFNNKKKPMLGINPGASYGNAKRWYPKEFSEVVRVLSSKYDITLLGGPDEKEIAMDIQKLIEEKGVKNYQNLAGKLTIPQLIICISNFDLFITGDSGPMHVAANYKVPTISIFGPTKSDETSQWKNDKSIIIKKHLECQPCMKRTCPLGHHDCMKLIKAKDVLTKIPLLSM